MAGYNLPPIGTWSAKQSQVLGPDRGQYVDKAPYFHRDETEGSVSKAVDKLNKGELKAEVGYCIAYSQSSAVFYLLWEQDKKEVAFSALGLYSSSVKQFPDGATLVVMGDTSTGKDTVVNFLLGMSLFFEPLRGPGGGRRPTVICQEHDPSADELRYHVKFTKGDATLEKEATSVLEIRDIITAANNPTNTEYFDAVNDSDPSDEAFDDEPVYMTIQHKEFLNRLQVVNLPYSFPTEMARKYCKEDSNVIVVLGTEKPQNSTWPRLKDDLSGCRKVIFVQNFASKMIDNITEVANFVEKEVPNSDKIYLVEFGQPKSRRLVDSGLWKEGHDQEDWLAIEDPAQLQHAMANHDDTVSTRLAKQNPALTDNFGFGIAGVKSSFGTATVLQLSAVACGPDELAITCQSISGDIVGVLNVPSKSNAVQLPGRIQTSLKESCAGQLRLLLPSGNLLRDAIQHKPNANILQVFGIESHE